MRNEPHRGAVRRAISVVLVSALLIAGASAHAGQAPASGRTEPLFGVFHEEIPIEVPDFHGIEPRIALEYTSSGGNGFAGVGWRIEGFSTIERLGPGKGAPRFDGNDSFVMDGQDLVTCPYGSVSPSCSSGGTHATKIESYVKVRYDSSLNRWYVWRKDGTTFEYLPLYTDAPSTIRWAAYYVTDRNGNQLTFAWWCDGANDCYPDNVTYNGTRVQLHREARPDPYYFAKGGSTLGRMNYRLKTIDVTVGGSRLAAYRLNYQGGSSSSRSLLSSISRYGRDATVDAYGNVTGGSTLPTISVGYPYSYNGWRYEQGFDTYNDGDGVTTNNNIFRNGSDQKGYGNNAFDNENIETFQFADVNGDGRADACIRMDYGIHCYLSNGTRFEYSTAWDSRIFTSYSANSEDNWRTLQFPDVTGDGKADACFRRDSGLQCCVATPNGFNCVDHPGYNTSYWANATNFDENNWKTIQFPDVNGDGKADACIRRDSGVQCLLSTGTSFVYSAGYDTTLLADQANFDTNNWSTLRFPDVDGDGKADMAIRLDSGVRFWLSTGSGFVLPPGTQAQFFQDGFDQKGYGSFDGDNWGTIQFVDVNADGKADACGRMDYGLHCYLSTGRAFVYAYGYDSYATGQRIFRNGSDQRGYGTFDGDNWPTLRMVDVNNDSLADACVRMDYGLHCYLSTGNGWIASNPFDTWWTGQYYLKNGSDQRGYGTFDADNWGTLQLVDVKGDGKSHPCVRMDYGVHCYIDRPVPELLSSISNGMGGSVSVTYVPSSTWTNDNNPPLEYTVRTVSEDNGRGSYRTTSYSYQGGLYDALERRFLGFYYVKETLPCLTGEYACPYVETWFRRSYGMVPKPEIIRRVDPQVGAVMSQTTLTYSENGGTVPYTSLLSQQCEYAYSGGTSKETCVSRSYDAYGNPVQEVTYGDRWVSGDEKTIRYTYRPNTSLYIVDKPAVVDVFEGQGTGGALLAQSVFYYDGAATWDQPPVRGQLTMTARWHDRTNSYVTTSAEYDAWGNVIATVDELGARRSLFYDGTYHRFVVGETNPLGQYTSAAWDAVCGVQTQGTDPNGLTTTTTYDAFCRPTRIDRPGGDFEAFSYVYFGNAWMQYRQVDRPSADGVNNAWKREHFDGQGRVWRVEQIAPAGRTILEDVEYNERGQVARKTAEYYSDEAPQWTTLSYDPLDRLVKVTYPDGTYESTYYRAGVTETIDELGHRQEDELDAYGRLVEHREFADGGAYATRYWYDARGNPSYTRDAQGNLAAFQFDSLGRKIQQQDPNTGTWIYEYDAAGRETAHVDAKLQRTEYTYDALGRRRSKTILAGTLSAVTSWWIYDEQRPGHYNIGYLTRTDDPAGQATYDYDAAGNVVRGTRAIEGSTYTFEKRYDAAGRLLGTTYPDGEMVGSPWDPLRYDAAGRLKVIPGIVVNAEYTAAGELQRLENANGTVTDRSYSAQRGWLTRILTTVAGRTVQDLGYGRDAEGKITSITSPFANESWSYGYDELDRVMAATNPGNAGLNQWFSYDGAGNILQNSRLGSYGYGPVGGARPHAVTQAGANTYAYDANGNMVSGAGRTIAWDGDNRPIAINGTSFAYDADGNRLRKSSGGTVTHYLGSDYEVTNGISTKYITLAGLLVAKRTNGLTWWQHTDHQGTVQAITDASGNEVQRLSYRPYGERFSSTSGHAESRGYSAQRQDESGLVYLHARYYDPVLGRFISPDPVVGSPRNVGLNRYAYAANDFVNNTDIDGLKSWWKKKWNSLKSWVRKQIRNNKYYKLGKAFLKGISHGDWKDFRQVGSDIVSDLAGKLVTVAVTAILTALTVPPPIARAIGESLGGFTRGFVKARMEGASTKEALRAGLHGAVQSLANHALHEFGRSMTGQAPEWSYTQHVRIKWLRIDTNITIRLRLEVDPAGKVGVSGVIESDDKLFGKLPVRHRFRYWVLEKKENESTPSQAVVGDEIQALQWTSTAAGQSREGFLSNSSGQSFGGLPAFAGAL